MTATIAAQLLFGLLLAILVAAGPGLLEGSGGRLLTLAALGFLPLILTLEVTSLHLEHSKRTSFCLSCHEMAPFGRSLRVSAPSYLAATHFQNHLVPPGQACYTCHTSYAMHGDLRAKLRGLRHMWVHYFGGEIEPAGIELYGRYQNRDCLACHGDARDFRETPLHASIFDALRSERVSCLECHRPVHDVGGLSDVELWQPPEGEPVGP